MSMKCICGYEGCDSRLVLSTFTDHATVRAEKRVRDKDGKLLLDKDHFSEESVRLDANGLVSLIREAKKALLFLSEEKEDF